MSVIIQQEIITNINQLKTDAYYTYADYLNWKFDEMVELIKGKLFKMSPAPNLDHQVISSNLIRILDAYLINKPCTLFHAPFDVRFPSKDDSITNTIVQPDLCVVCDLKKLDKQGCKGAPDLVVEILSPGNSDKEMTDKFNLYESEGVKEYWLVNPEEKWLVIYTLNDTNKYIGSKLFTPKDGIIKSVIFPDLQIDLNKVFDLLVLDD